MLEFIVYLIKYTVIFACNFYVFAKIAASRLKIWDIFFIILFAAAAFGLYFVTVHAKIFVPIAILLFSVVVFLLRFRQPLSDTVSLSIVSFGITIFSMVISVTLLVPVFSPISHYYNNDTIEQAGRIVQSVGYAIFIIILFHIKKFKNSLTPTTFNEVYEKLLLAGVICIFSMTLFYTVDKTDETIKVIAVVIVFSGLMLLTQWRKTITSRYYKQLERRNFERLQSVLEQYQLKCDGLLKKNAELAKIIHRDNKLLPAMNVAVINASKKYPKDKELQKLAQTLEKVYCERSGLIESFAPAKGGNSSGVLSVDAVMDYFHFRAAKSGVEFNYDFNAQAFAQILNVFSEHTALNETLCDLVENALIAVRGKENARVCLRVCEENGFACIKVFDDGEDFDEQVLRGMGRRRITTHEHEGGSGIGLMTLFDTLRSCKATFLLDEEPQGGFKKCVCITFDGKDGCFIKSSRPCVKKICAERENFLVIKED
ncbi:MAG: hypothetical protein K2L67_02470 [Clostridia bacterium]|nr:hypothetical protein [Clostridia bacterium]